MNLIRDCLTHAVKGLLRYLLEYLLHRYGITPNNIKHINLSPDSFIIHLVDKTLKHIPLSDAKDHIMNRCKTCADFTSEFADLSVGGASPLEGWSTVIARTERGEEIFRQAVKEGFIETRKMEPEVFAHIVHLALYKRESALQEIRDLSLSGLPVPGAMKASEKLASGGDRELERIRVGEAMTRKIVCLRDDLTVSELLDKIVEYHHIGYPVIDESNRLIGIVTLQDAMKVPKDRRGETRIREICTRKLVTVSPDDNLLEALEKMSAHNIGRLLVTDRENKSLLLGIVTRSDILRELTKNISYSIGKIGA